MIKEGICPKYIMREGWHGNIQAPKSYAMPYVALRYIGALAALVAALAMARFAYAEYGATPPESHTDHISALALELFGHTHDSLAQRRWRCNASSSVPGMPHVTVPTLLPNAPGLRKIRFPWLALDRSDTRSALQMQHCLLQWLTNETGAICVSSFTLGATTRALVARAHPGAEPRVYWDPVLSSASNATIELSMTDAVLRETRYRVRTPRLVPVAYAHLESVFRNHSVTLRGVAAHCAWATLV